jgi:flavin-binding protein dodecin
MSRECRDCAAFSAAHSKKAMARAAPDIRSTSAAAGARFEATTRRQAGTHRFCDAPTMAREARGTSPASQPQERNMAKTKSETGVYRVTQVIGVSPVSWEDAAKAAVETAASSLRDLRIAEVEKLDVKIEDGKVVAFRTKLSLSFKYEG